MKLMCPMGMAALALGVAWGMGVQPAAWGSTMRPDPVPNGRESVLLQTTTHPATVPYVRGTAAAQGTKENGAAKRTAGKADEPAVNDLSQIGKIPGTEGQNGDKTSGEYLSPSSSANSRFNILDLLGLPMTTGLGAPQNAPNAFRPYSPRVFILPLLLAALIVTSGIYLLRRRHHR